MYNLSIFSERLKEQMFEFDEDFTAKKFAEKIGVTDATVYGWLNEKKEISLSHAVAVADFFGCNLDYFVGTRPFETVTPRPLPPFYERLREIMREKHISRYHLVKNKILGDSFFTNWANGQKPRLATVCSVAKHLNVSLDYLVGRTDY